MLSKNKPGIMGNYAEVNGINMYYELQGEGDPLVLIHGGGSTIDSSFGRLIPLLSRTRKIIAMELQAHGRTGDREQFLSFHQDADDVAALMEQLDIAKASILGFSNGGQTAIQLALSYPSLVNKLVLCSTFYKRSAALPEFWNGFETAKFTDMPQVYADAFLKVNNDERALHNMFNKDVQRMKNFAGWTDEEIGCIKLPTLVVNANADVGSPEHAVEMHRRIKGSTLLILPGGHGAYLGEVFASAENSTAHHHFAALLETFLEE
jgi:pimeloyl-ACP methyl ester carboxylesterase